MRLSLFALWAVPLVALATSVCSGETLFPYKAYVTTDNTYVRSGPGSDYYPTDKLAAGTAVEIYRHDPGGWCAIRPPEGSFAWVSTRYLKPTGDGLAEVTGDRVAARVGSRYSSVRDVVQVRLHQGELVEMIEPPSRSSVAGDEGLWVKIAPPAGEFRWIDAKHVDPDYPVDGVRRAPAEESPLYQAARPGRGGELASARDAARPLRGEPGAIALPADALPAQRPAAPPLSADEFQRRLEETELALATMVAEEPTVWKFDRLVPEAETLVSRAETAVQRGRARLLLDKMDRYASLRDRFDAAGSMLATRERLDRRLADLRSRPDDMGTGADDRYDGQGRLTRVVSPKPGAPRYALVDASGQVRCYVTPAPGVNLQHYEQRWVGVNGTRGYIPDQQAHHVTAQHVNVLDDRVLR
ncbi:MAG: SH3 domain-containing protein [Pirellulales bacterium]|nr:SH3 domain-containing protein [Pirellulales bacterium]